jgi:hypothetical protein
LRREHERQLETKLELAKKLECAAMKKLEYETMRAEYRAEFDAEHHAEFEELEAKRECKR